MKQKGSTTTIIIFSIIAVAILVGIGLLFLQTSRVLPAVTPAPLISPTSSATASPTPVATAGSTVVVIESKASISAADLDQLQKRVINPYLDFYKETNGTDYLVSLTIGINSQASKSSYPYTAKGIYKNGAFNDFLIEKNASGIVWWVPECLNGCQLSEGFKTKYPEIAAKVQ